MGVKALGCAGLYLPQMDRNPENAGRIHLGQCYWRSITSVARGASGVAALAQARAGRNHGGRGESPASSRAALFSCRQRLQNRRTPGVAALVSMGSTERAEAGQRNAPAGNLPGVLSRLLSDYGVPFLSITCGRTAVGRRLLFMPPPPWRRLRKRSGAAFRRLSRDAAERPPSGCPSSRSLPQRLAGGRHHLPPLAAPLRASTACADSPRC